jgi:hypothetical protein
MWVIYREGVADDLFSWRTTLIIKRTPMPAAAELAALRAALRAEFGDSAKATVVSRTRQIRFSTSETVTETVLEVEALLSHYSGYQAVGAMYERAHPVIEGAIGRYDRVNHGAEPEDGDWGPWNASNS